MNIITGNAIYLITNLFRTYVLHRFLSVFLKRNIEIKNKVEIFLYVGYYIVNSSINLVFFNPFVNLVSNLILFYLLTFIYDGKIITRIVSVVIMYSSSMMFETIVYNLSARFNLSFNLKDFTIIVSNLLLFILTLLLERKIGKKRIINVRGVHLLMVFCIPLCSIAVVAILFLAKISSIFTIIIVSILFSINIINFYLYDILIKYYNDKYENDLLKQQNDAYLNQLEIIRESQKNIKMLKHDMKNHVISIQNMIKNVSNVELNDYLETMLDNVNNKKEYVNSGNTEIDSLLNYKINEAAELCSNLDIDINIPNNINIELFDLVVILGNLLDNSLDAIRKVPDKYLYVEIKLEKSMLFITVKNTFDGMINKSDNRILTTKNDIHNHGLGLINIENIINKYNGSLDIEYDENTFLVDVVLYVNKNSNNQVENA